jgi:hypothetical protein
MVEQRADTWPRSGRNPRRYVDLGRLRPRQGARVFQPTKAGAVDKSIRVFHLYNDTVLGRVESAVVSWICALTARSWAKVSWLSKRDELETDRLSG